MNSHQDALLNPKVWTVREPSGDPRLSLLPLQGDISKALTRELIRDGCGDRCGECGKPFNAVRKHRGIGRVTHLAPADGMLYSMAWLLCGPCTRAMKSNDNRVSDRLIAEARASLDAHLLLAEPVRGSA
jgi:hypothetical protein